MPFKTSHLFNASRLLPCALLLLLLSACANDPDMPPMAMPEVPSAFAMKVSGRWALAVVNASLNTQIAAPGLACGDMTFPVDMDSLFRRYMVQSFGQIADDVTLVDHPLTDDEVRAGGYLGQIVIGSVALAPNVKFSQDGLTALVDSSMALSATMDVGSRRGHLLHRAFTVDGISHIDAGIISQRGSRGLGRAADSAMQQLSVGTASAFGDSPDVRLLAAEAVR